jgi:hypothetical protein
MASGAIPYPDRVPEQRLLSPELHLRQRRCCETLSGKTPIDLGFSHRRLFYRRRGVVRGHPGAPHHSVARPGVQPHHQVVWPPPGPPSSLLWTPSHVGENRNFGLRFVQLQEYFLCNFSETQKQQKTGTSTVASY